MNELDEEYISHHGILGQKWGVRRYQNTDGTLTEEGKARYTDSGRNNWHPKDVKNLSDAELKRRIARLNMEKQYKDMTTPPMNKQTKEILKQIFLQTAITIAAGYMATKYKAVAAAGKDWLTSKQATKYIQVAAKVNGAQWVI